MKLSGTVEECFQQLADKIVQMERDFDYRLQAHRNITRLILLRFLHDKELLVADEWNSEVSRLLLFIEELQRSANDDAVGVAMKSAYDIIAAETKEFLVEVDQKSSGPKFDVIIGGKSDPIS